MINTDCVKVLNLKKTWDKLSYQVDYPEASHVQCYVWYQVRDRVWLEVQFKVWIRVL